MILENWYITDDFKLAGEVYNHHKYKAGSPIRTSKVAHLNEEHWIAKTISGSVYTLGKPNGKYLNYLLRNNFDSGKRLQKRNEDVYGEKPQIITEEDFDFTGIFKMSDN